ncbi:MAG: acyltransferase [Burkholderiaceae bacterium]|nr:acyltransferase [Burkholderiaceae bacterium]
MTALAWPASETRDWKLPYNPALDGLRAIAITLVILSHAHVPGVDGAFFGVDLFFVLSGYLITSLLLIEIEQTGHINLWRFYRRRFFRLMPALLAFLAAYCLIAPLIWPADGDWYRDAAVSGLYLADYGIAFFDSPGSLLHMWSLSVEEHYYLLWPLALLAISALLPRGALWRVAGALFLLVWGWRVFWVWQGQQFYELFFRFDTRAAGLLAGSLLAALLRERPAWFQRLRQHARWGPWLLALAPLWIGLKWDDMHVMTWAMTLVELTAVALLLAVLPASASAAGRAAPRGWLYALLSQPALVKVGQLSYAIYLWHYPIVRALRAHLDWPWTVLLGGALSALMAQLSWITVERWGRAWRDRKAAQALRV